MARPIKNGIDYFSLDTDFWDNRKIKLIRGEFGMTGVGLYVTLLAQIYGSRGYYMVWDNDMECLLMSQGAASGCSPNLIKEVITGCLRCSLFDKRVFEVFGVLTSAEIQRRYLKAVEKRQRITVIKEYWLLNVNDEEDVSANVLKKLAFKSVSGELTAVNSEITPVNSESIPQRRSEKIRVDQSRSSPRARSDTNAECAPDDINNEMMRLTDRIEFYVLDRKARPDEREEIRKLLSQYGRTVMDEAVTTAIRMNGKSVKYLRKCAETAAVRKADNDNASGEERYAPTYDISEIEAMLNAEWFGDEEGK